MDQETLLRAVSVINSAPPGASMSRERWIDWLLAQILAHGQQVDNRGHVEAEERSNRRSADIEERLNSGSVDIEERLISRNVEAEERLISRDVEVEERLNSVSVEEEKRLYSVVQDWDSVGEESVGMKMLGSESHEEAVSGLAGVSGHLRHEVFKILATQFLEEIHQICAVEKSPEGQHPPPATTISSTALLSYLTTGRVHPLQNKISRWFSSRTGNNAIWDVFFFITPDISDGGLGFAPRVVSPVSFIYCLEIFIQNEFCSPILRNFK